MKEEKRFSEFSDISALTLSDEENEEAEAKTDEPTAAGDAEEEFPAVDVCIIGAGPAGLLLAIELVKRNVDVFIVDNLKSDYTSIVENSNLPTQAMLLNSVSLETLKDTELLESLTPMAKVLRGGSILSEGKVIAQVARVSNKSLLHAAAIVIPQWQLEKVLVEKLREYGCTVKRNFMVNKIIVKDGDSEGNEFRVHVEARKIDPVLRKLDDKGGDSAFLKVKCRYLVGADGIRSLVRRAMRAEYCSPNEGGLFVSEHLIADVQISKWGGGTSQILNSIQESTSRSTTLEADHFFVYHGTQAIGTLVLYPYSQKGSWRIMLKKNNDSDLVVTSDGKEYDTGFRKFETPTSEEVEELLNMLIPNTKVSEVRWRQAFATEVRVSSTLVNGPLILVGDAVRQLPPTWCDGLNAAFADVEAVAWRLGQIIHGEAEASTLTQYEEERKLFNDQRILPSLQCKAPLLWTDINWNPFTQWLLGGRSGLENGIKQVIEGPQPNHLNCVRAGDEFICGPKIVACSVLLCNTNEEVPPKLTKLEEICKCGSPILFVVLRIVNSLGNVKSTNVFASENMSPAIDTKTLDEASNLAALGNSNESIKVIWVLSGLEQNFAKSTSVSTLIKNPRLIYEQLHPQVINRIGNGGYYIVDHIGEFSNLTNVCADREIPILKRLCSPTKFQKGCSGFVLTRPDGRIVSRGDGNQQVAADRLKMWLLAATL